MGAWCGYVVVAPWFHPWYRRTYNHIGAEAHGGPTFASFEDRLDVLAVLPLPKRKRWVIGFDCNHFQDEAPGMLTYQDKMGDPWKVFARFSGFYRDQVYVQAETEQLADQVRQAKYKFWLRLQYGKASFLWQMWQALWPEDNRVRSRYATWYLTALTAIAAILNVIT